MQMTKEELGAFRLELGDNIRAARKTAGISQMDMAKFLNVNRPTYSKIERGETAMRVEVLAEFCEALGCDVDSIMPKTSAGKAKDEGSIAASVRQIYRGQIVLEKGIRRLSGLIGVNLGE